jgi:hypothetical protein
LEGTRRMLEDYLSFLGFEPPAVVVATFGSTRAPAAETHNAPGGKRTWEFRVRRRNNTVGHSTTERQP